MAGLLGLEAPRYTSYPSAHHFSPQVNPETHAAWLANIYKNATISAYVHIPFCKELCWFCGCHTKMTKRYEPIAKYVRVLLQEIETAGANDVVVTTSGCMGLCSREPLVTVEILNQEPIKYEYMNSNKRRQVFKRHIQGGEIQTPFVLARGAEVIK